MKATQPVRAPPLTGRRAGAFRPPAPGTDLEGTAHSGAPPRNGRTLIPAFAASSTWLSKLLQSNWPLLTGCTDPQPTGMRMLSTPPVPSRWNWSVLRLLCGTTPQKPAGSACAAEAEMAKIAAVAAATVQARTILFINSLLFGMVSSPSARKRRTRGDPGDA